MVHVLSHLSDSEIDDVRIDSSGAPRIFDGGGGVRSKQQQLIWIKIA
jgi:hypothetical protein